MVLQPLTTLKWDPGIEEFIGVSHYHSHLSPPLATSSDSKMCLSKKTKSSVKESQRKWREDGECPIQSWTTPAFSDESSQQTSNLTGEFQCFPLMNPTPCLNPWSPPYSVLVRTWPGKQKLKDSVKNCDFSKWSKKKDLSKWRKIETGKSWPRGVEILGIWSRGVKPVEIVLLFEWIR